MLWINCFLEFGLSQLHILLSSYHLHVPALNKNKSRYSRYSRLRRHFGFRFCETETTPQMNSVQNNGLLICLELIKAFYLCHWLFQLHSQRSMAVWRGMCPTWITHTFLIRWIHYITVYWCVVSIETEFTKEFIPEKYISR